jgi:hypothetical protein
LKKCLRKKGLGDVRVELSERPGRRSVLSEEEMIWDMSEMVEQAKTGYVRMR